MKANLLICKATLLVIMSCIYLTGYAQSPQGFNYQAVARNADGSPMGNTTVGVKITLEDASHVAYYSETHAPQTNAQGVFSIIIGNGNQVGNDLFENIPWSKGDVFLKLEVDPLGGTAYAQVGNIAQLQAVPYALYAENTKEVVSQPTALDDDPIFVVKNKAGQVVFAVYQTGVRVFVEDSPIVKGARGGFAVGGLSQTKAGTGLEFFRITSDSARVYLKPVTGKGARGGFAVGGLSQSKGNDDYFNVSPNNIPSTIASSAQMLWYPLKEAFLVGRVEILDPNDVGLNSFASGYHSKAKGNYSQALGTNSVSSGLYSTAIGQSCLSSGSYSFSFGSNAQATNTNNVAIGNNAQAIGFSNNYAFGNNAIASGDNDNYAFGSNSKIVEGRNCYAIGSNAEIYPVIYNGSGSAGSYAIGNYALVRGQRAYAIGDHARALNNDAIAFGTNTKATAYTSIAIGANGSNADTTFATGQASIAIGYAASSDGSSSISIGTRSIASGIYSCALGDGAQATGALSAAFGKDAKSTYSNSSAFGNGAITDGDNTIRLGNGSVEFIKGNVGISISSDKRLKKNIKEVGAGLDFILKLQPVEYQMLQGNERLNYGFIAQDIEQLLGTNNNILTIDGDANRTLGLRYTDFIAPLVKAIQEQQKQIEELKQQNKEIESLKAELEAIKTLLKK